MNPQDPSENHNKPKQRRYRIADVAKHAGVSEAAVSVVLNNRVGEQVRVSEETQRKIWDAVRELGYIANPLARNLAGGRNHLLAVFTFESIFPIDARNFYYPFLVGIEEEASAQDYDLLLMTASGNGSGKRSIYKNGINRLKLADAALLLGHPHDREEVYRLQHEGYPFVYVGRRDSPNDDLSYVAADYVSATEHIVQYLFDNGHRKQVMLRTTRQTEASQDRETGYVHMHETRGFTPTIWRGEPDEFQDALFERYLRSGVTAFVAEDDQLGLRLRQVGGRLGYRCPVDYSMVVLGDPLGMLETEYTWTTFKIPRREMGHEAVRLALQMLTDGEERPTTYRTMLPCEFVPGNTVQRLDL